MYFAALKGVSPTAACKESGVGTSFLPDVKRGRQPSIDKFERLASYLGTTVSELLGEADPGLGGPPQRYLVMRYNSLSPESQDKLMTFLEYLVAEESKKNVSDSDTLSITALTLALAVSCTHTKLLGHPLNCHVL